MSVFRLSQVSKRFEGSAGTAALWALRDLDLEVAGGRIGLWGPNGAGKSTLMRLLLGLLQPDAGRVEVLGFDVRRQSLEVRAAVGFMADGGPVVPEINAVECVTLAAELVGLPRGYAKVRGHRLLDYVGIGEARYRPLVGYSKGMRQRVGLAQALVGDPRLLVLDEPTNGLDPQESANILQLIDEFSAQTGAHVLLASHVLSDIENHCEQVVCLAAGSLRYAGPIADLLASDGRTYLLRPKGTLEDARGVLQSLGLRAELRGDGLRLRLQEGETPASLLRLLSDAGVEVRRLVPEVPSLAAMLES